MELASGTATEAKLSGRIARLCAKFDFAAIIQLAGAMQANPEDSRATT
jgi:hypothetical protein